MTPVQHRGGNSRWAMARNTLKLLLGKSWEEEGERGSEVEKKGGMWMRWTGLTGGRSRREGLAVNSPLQESFWKKGYN